MSADRVERILTILARLPEDKQEVVFAYMQGLVDMAERLCKPEEKV